MTDRELMQQALEALEADEHDMVPDQEGHMVFRKEAAINALRDRLAQPDAYGYASRLAVAIWEQHYKDVAPQWKPLDDLMGVLTQIDNMTSGLTRLAQPNDFNPDWDAMAVMVAEQQRMAKRIAELEAQPEQEPKCGAIIEVFGNDWQLEYMSLPVGKHKLYTQQYNYTAPPQRKPLTEEEIWELAAHCLDSVAGRMQFARAIEAKLKAKNS